jgi:hypothetical protein
MKNAKKAFYGLALVAGSALTVALSSVPVPVSAQAPVCLNVTEILTTQPTDMRTILYRMRNGDVWRNDLAYPCPDLVNFSGGGYVQKSHTDWICGNTQMITTQTGSVCRLGRFTRIN